MTKVFIVTGEASGDHHGALLIKELQKRSPDLEIHAAGGNQIKSLKTQAFFSMAHLNATGATEIIKHLPEYLKVFQKIKDHILSIKPDLVVFIDNPGFNLRLAKALKKHGIPLMYYICPQIWAWNQKRIHLIKKLFRKVLVIFNFEVDFYNSHEIPVEFVGHPLNDMAEINEINSPPKKDHILLLPGSRVNEVSRLLPIQLKAAETIISKNPNASFTLLKADTLNDNFYESILSQSNIKIESVRENKYKHMTNASFGMVCSGTATLEGMLCNLPMIVLYKSSFITYVLAKILVKIKHISLPNILHGSELIPELLQYDCNANAISSYACRWLNQPEELNRIRREFKSISSGLGNKGASSNAAISILEELKKLQGR